MSSSSGSNTAGKSGRSPLASAPRAGTGAPSGPGSAPSPSVWSKTSCTWKNSSLKVW